MRKCDAYRDSAAVAASAASWNRHMRILDAQLAATGAFTVGSDFTLADLVLGLAAHRWLMTPIERPLLPAVLAWLASLAGRSPFAAYCTEALP